MHDVGPPRVFGPYRVGELIARSATASVHRATDTRHDDRVVALKIFAPHLSADPAFRDRFRRDAAAVSALHEPHVVSVHTYGELAGAVYLDMRLVTGPSLAEARAGGPLDPARAATIAAQLADAIAAVTAGDLGPRTVDPAEVLLTGAKGAEFVQLVGLGLGRPPVGRPPDAAELVGVPATDRGRRGRWRTGAALVTALAVVAIVVVAVRSSGRPVPPPGAIAVLDGTVVVTAATTTQLDGRTVVVGVLSDGAVRTWDITTGEVEGPTLDGSTRSVGTAVLDGDPVVVTRDDDQVVHVRSLRDGRTAVAAIGAPEPPDPLRWGSQARAAVPAELGGRPVVVLPEPADPATYGKDQRLGYRVRALADGADIGPLVSVPGASLSTLPTTTVLDGDPVVVTTADDDGDGTATVGGVAEQRVLRVFDMATGAAIGRPTTLPAGVTAFDVGVRDGAPVAVLGCADNTVRLADLHTGALVGPALTGNRWPVRALAVVADGSRSLVVSEAGPRSSRRPSEVRFFDLATGAPVGPVLRDHPAGAGLLTAARVGDGTVLVSADATQDGTGTVTVWKLAALLGEDGS